MRLDDLLRAHGFMKVERPPELWEADTEALRFVPLLDEMIAASLARGAELAGLTLNASNVVVEGGGDHEERPPAPGDYVAVTVSGNVDWEADAVWYPEGPSPQGKLGEIGDPLLDAGARYAYIRRMPPKGSITVFFSRLRQ